MLLQINQTFHSLKNPLLGGLGPPYYVLLQLYIEHIATVYYLLHHQTDRNKREMTPVRDS